MYSLFGFDYRLGLLVDFLHEPKQFPAGVTFQFLLLVFFLQYYENGARLVHSQLVEAANARPGVILLLFGGTGVVWMQGLFLGNVRQNLVQLYSHFSQRLSACVLSVFNNFDGVFMTTFSLNFWPCRSFLAFALFLLRFATSLFHVCGVCCDADLAEK